MTTELAVSQDGEVMEQRAPMTLFGTDNPAAVVERASAVATSLGAVINERKLFASIGGKKHVQVEGWTLLGSMLGVFAEVEWSRPLDNGWEARAVARTLAGNVVGAAEAMCTVNEGRWKNADTYAVRSMAQTRAVSKALRMPLGFIMHLAGYSATPAEEVPDEQPERSERASASGDAKPATTSAPVQRSAEEQALLDRILAEPGMNHARMTLMADGVGVPKTRRANADELRAMIAQFIEQPAAEPKSAGRTGGGEASSDLPAADTPLSEGIADSSASDAATVSADSPHSPPAPAPTRPDAVASGMTNEEFHANLEAGHKRADQPVEALLDEAVRVAEAPTVPPKPNSAAYKALPSGVERAAAKAYHEAHPESEAETLAEQLGAPLA